jgi:predicted nucleic acid-binding protein
MILLDTNIISELMKPSPSAAVLAWLDEQESTQIFISTISIAEISYGINVLPKGKRRKQLEEACNKAILEAFQHRVLFFDETSAYLYGKIMSHRKSLGRPMSILDGQICATSRAHGLTVATRNTQDFAHCDVNLINPFEVGGT